MMYEPCGLSVGLITHVNGRHLTGPPTFFEAAEERRWHALPGIQRHE